MLKIKKEIFSSSLGVFFVYIIVSCIIIMTFRFIFPGEDAPLAHFSSTWRFLQGLLEYIRLFPALSLSALIVPFGFTRKQFQEKINPLTPNFLKALNLSIFSAILAAVIYGILSFLVFPLAQNYETTLIYQGRIYTHARVLAQNHANEGNWDETAQYLSVCESIWPNNPAMEALVIETNIQLESRRLYTEIDPLPVPTGSLPNRADGLSAMAALDQADTALEEGRYFDAHWLATMGSRIAGINSPERARANEIARRAWNGVNSTEPDLLAPTRIQTESHRIYNIKLDGYNALMGSDWILAYYTFLELRELSPNDPDIPRLLDLSENGLRDIAFFIDEIEMSLGRVLSSAVYSLPYNSGINNGRLVMRVFSLNTFNDVSYGVEMDLLAFDHNGMQLWSISAPYVKFLPVLINGNPSVSILMRAVDRRNSDLRWEPSLTSYASEDPLEGYRAEIILPISWEDFLLISYANRGLGSLTPMELRTGSMHLANYGYPPEIFNSELLQRFVRPVFLLPLGIFAITVGWRYRNLKRSRYMSIPMLGILPVVINGIEHFTRGWVNNIGIWAVINLGFNTAAVFFCIGIVVSLVLSLIILASQHN